MEVKTVEPAVVEGCAHAPASKSALQRAIACASLAEGLSRLRGVTLCSDALAALRVASGLGARVLQDGPAELRIEGRPPQPGTSFPGEAAGLSCGESGLCMRMYAPIAALQGRPVRLLAEGTLKKRPMHMVAEALSAFGARCSMGASGLPPLDICGPMQAGERMIDAQGSSQVVTGLLIALPLLDGDSVLEVRNPVSAGYLDLTRTVCKAFGVSIEQEEGRANRNGGPQAPQAIRFVIPGRQRYRPANIDIEGDWSGAAFLAVAGAIAGAETGLTVEGLDADSSQPDKAICRVLGDAGAQVSWNGNTLVIRPGSLVPFTFDATDCPDLFPPLAALASAIQGISTIRGVRRLAGKESDRARALQHVYDILGVRIDIEDDEMRIHGGNVHGGRIPTYGDHRIAMSGAIAALISDQPVEIEDAECVAKSWPEFFETLERLVRKART